MLNIWPIHILAGEREIGLNRLDCIVWTAHDQASDNIHLVAMQIFDCLECRVAHVLAVSACGFFADACRNLRSLSTLQERQIQMLASILKRYFKALSKDIPIDAKDLAGSLIALAQGLSLQRPYPNPENQVRPPA